MTRKENKLFVMISVALFFVLFLAIVGSKAFNNKITEMKNAQTKDSSAVDINWEERYPYDTTVEMVATVTDSNQNDISTIEKITSRISKLNTLGNSWSTLMYNYSDIAKAGYVINSRLTDPSVGDGYVKLKNGSWTIPESYIVSSDLANEAVAPYASLQNFVNEKGIDFLYFYAPFKECVIDDELPDDVISHTNENIDTYLAAMNSYGIDHVDLRKSIHEDGLDHYSMFYITDHHWTVEAGLWAASEVTQEVNSRFGAQMDDPKGETYKSVIYENAEFGSFGQGVTHYVAENEDFTMLFPEFETNYRLEIPNKEIDVTGSFGDIFIDYEGVNEVIAQGGGSVYGKILYGNIPYGKITNLNNPEGPKVLMLRDSFSIAVAPYLADSCSELVLLDARPGNGDFNGSIINCINDFDPDIVLVLQCVPENIVLNK